MKQTILKIANRIGDHLTRRNQRLGYDNLSLQRITPFLPENYLPWSVMAIRPSALEIIFNEIVIHQRKTIIECGCGISTILLSRFLAPYGGSIISIDSDLGWIDVVRDSLKDAPNASILHCPLKSQSVNGQSHNWFDLQPVHEHLKQKAPFDLLITDAPVGRVQKMARYPALPLLKQYLADDFSAFMDDIHRKDETAIVQKWASEFNMEETFFRTIGDIAVLRPKNTRTYYQIR